MAKAKKLKSGSWRVQVFSHYEIVSGQKKARYRSFTAPTKAEAEYAAAQFARDKDAVTSPHITVAQAVRHYIDVKDAVLSPATIKAYDSLYRNQMDEIGSLDVSRLTSDDLQHWIGVLSMTLSAKTVRNAYGLVISAISLFTTKSYRVTLPSRAPVERHIPTDEDVMHLMSEASDSLRLCIALAAVGTLRRGEICGLKYKDVRKDSIYVHSDVVQKTGGDWVHKDMPKTSASIRIVPLPAAVMTMIGSGEPEEYIYDDTPTSITDRFTRLRDRLGMQCRFHDLRHYAASIMHAIGVPDVYIMERGGWSTDSTLKSIYRNSLDDMSLKFANMANDHFANVISGS